MRRILIGILCIFLFAAAGCDDDFPDTGYNGDTDLSEPVYEDFIEDRAKEEVIAVPGADIENGDFGFENSDYVFLRGVAVSNDIYITGNVRIVGGVYAWRNINMSAGSIITGDSRYILDNLKRWSFEGQSLFQENPDADFDDVDGSHPARSLQPLYLRNMPLKPVPMQKREVQMTIEEWESLSK